MKLETPLLDKFLSMTMVSGAETVFTVKLPSGETQSVDMNALFREIHNALHSLHHFMDPGGAHHTGFPVIQQQSSPQENATAQAAIGHVVVPPFKEPLPEDVEVEEKHERHGRKKK
jgi:hypothetical protein